MNRQERRAQARETREQAKAWPHYLVEVPESELPQLPPGFERPRAVWRSRHYLAMSFAAPAFQGIDCLRLTVNRVTTGTDGRWDQDIPWEDLQRCKRETGHGDWYGVEIYPRDRDIVNVANMRHLWLLAAPLDIGWFENPLAVRGEGSTHDLPSRTAEADAAIGQPRVTAPGTAEVAPLGGGYGASFEEEDS